MPRDHPLIFVEFLKWHLIYFLCKAKIKGFWFNDKWEYLESDFGKKGQATSVPSGREPKTQDPRLGQDFVKDCKLKR